MQLKNRLVSKRYSWAIRTMESHMADDATQQTPTASKRGAKVLIALAILAALGAGTAGFALACQQIDDYVRPTWPDGPVPAQSHLDLHVDSIEESTPLVEAAGATRHAHHPGEEGGIGDAGRFVVFVDPAGHLFCLCEP